MLAKQPWRLISQQTSLFFQVYKVRYFPNGSFVDASLGSNPSYMWRSVLKAKDIILARSKWKVGSGDLIHIFYHQWLPRPLCLRKEGLGPMKVGELINVETRQWDRAKLAYWFEPTHAMISYTYLCQIYSPMMCKCGRRTNPTRSQLNRRTQ